MVDKNIQEEGHSPGYYVKKRLLRNRLAIFGLIYILFSLLIAILGYTIMPDNSPNANDGAIQIKKLLPGDKVLFIKKRKNIKYEEPNFFEVLVSGKPSPYILTPISDYKVDGLRVLFKEYGGTGDFEEMNLVDVVYPIYISTTRLRNKAADSDIVQVGDKVRFTSFSGRARELAYDQLLREFKEEHLEERTYLLGTDNSGRGILSQLIFGFRISLSIGLISVLISTTLGLTLGAVAGFFGGIVDNIIQFFMTVVWSIPGIMLVICISLALQSKGIWVAFVAVGLTTWVEIARVVRGQFLAIKGKTYIEAARAIGTRNRKIIFSHIMPNVLGAIIVIATANFATAILIEAGLSFLGLGVQPPMPSWGYMINEGYDSFPSRNSWHIILFPSLAISLMVLAFNLFGNGLRDAYDPSNK